MNKESESATGGKYSPCVTRDFTSFREAGSRSPGLEGEHRYLVLAEENCDGALFDLACEISTHSNRNLPER